MNSLISKLCFIAFGVTAFLTPINKFNLIYIIFGSLAGLLFGFLFKLIIKIFFRLFNYNYKDVSIKKEFSKAVDRGMLFLFPFAVMAVFAVYFMNWSATYGFVSAGLMSAGASSAMEIGKIKGRQEIKDTIIFSMISYVFSSLWMLSSVYFVKIPSYLEGSIGIIKLILGGKAL